MYLNLTHTTIGLKVKTGAAFLLAILFSLNVLTARSQTTTKPVPDKKRTAQWKPQLGQYYFSHKLVYEYEVDKEKGTMKIAVDPVTGALCFEKKDTYGTTAENFDFILAFPDGKYIYCGADDAGKKIKITEILKDLKPDAEKEKDRQQDFADHLKATGNIRTDFGWPSVEYEQTYETSENKDLIWLTEMPFSVSHLYGFELLEGTASLPVPMDYLYLLGSHQLMTELQSKDVKVKLVSIDAEPVIINTKVYKEIKIAD